MIRSTRRRIGLAAAAAGVALAAPVAAAAQASEPETSAVGSWLVTCVDPNTAAVRCEMAQRVVDDAGAIQILRAAITAAREAPPAEITFTTPLGVWLEPGALLALPSGFTRTLEYERCAPDGCVLHVALDEELRAAFDVGGLAEFRFADRLKQPLSVPVSLDGFADAVAMLETETAPAPRSIVSWFRRFRG